MGPCLSPHVAGRPLRPATDHRLGEPLPHQRANRPQAPPKASPKTLSSFAPPANEHMRNYPSFPRATPHLRADCPRVPHPSATPRDESRTFDLHALGTPPALILSQDQTLHQFLLRSLISPSSDRAASFHFCGRVHAQTNPTSLVLNPPTHRASFPDFKPLATLSKPPSSRLSPAPFPAPNPTSKAPPIKRAKTLSFSAHSVFHGPSPKIHPQKSQSRRSASLSKYRLPPKVFSLLSKREPL